MSSVTVRNLAPLVFIGSRLEYGLALRGWSGRLSGRMGIEISTCGNV